MCFKFLRSFKEIFYGHGKKLIHVFKSIPAEEMFAIVFQTRHFLNGIVLKRGHPFRADYLILVAHNFVFQPKRMCKFMQK